MRGCYNKLSKYKNYIMQNIERLILKNILYFYKKNFNVCYLNIFKNKINLFVGGIYFIISRSLGPEFGASVGIVFACANSVAASMNTIGFCDSLNDLLKSYDLKIIDNSVNDIRIVGVIALIVMILICAIGMEWESKVLD